ncbi:MAG: DUF2142 domain-containing protein, partial [Bifidobacteriaceae bacterium]|nr:DUF2142 domain-containing protein [Bifidobacteriaceae bacterium]
MGHLQLTREKYDFPTWRSNSLKPAGNYGENGTADFVFSNSAINSPIVYLPQTIGFFIAKHFTHNVTKLIIVARLAGVFFLALAIFFSIKLIPIGKYAIAAIALIPTTIIVNSCISADTVTLSICFVFITALLRIIAQSSVSKLNWIALAITSCCMGLIKLTYLPFLLFLLLIPLLNERYRNKNTYKILGSIAAVSCILFVLWYMQIKSINTGAMYNAAVDPSAQLKFIITHPIHFIKTVVITTLLINFFQVGDYTVLGAHGVPHGGEWWLILAFIFAVIMKGKDEKHFFINRVKAMQLSIYFIGIFVIIVGLIILALYLQFTPVSLWYA